MTTAASNSPTARPVSRILTAGLVAGLVSTILAIVFHTVRQAMTGLAYQELNVVSITATAMLTSLIGSLVYWLLSRSGRDPGRTFTVIGLGAAILTALPAIVAPMYPGFGLATVPLHLIVAVVAVVVIPWRARA